MFRKKGEKWVKKDGSLGSARIIEIDAADNHFARVAIYDNAGKKVSEKWILHVELSIAWKPATI